MRPTPYINTDEGRELMIMSAIWDGLLHLIDSTKEVPYWQGCFASALMRVCTVFDLRIKYLDGKELKKARRRIHSVNIVPADYDFSGRRCVNYTVPEDDLLEVVNVVCEKYCYGCTKKKWRSCKWRQHFNHLGLFSIIDGPANECQFKVDRWDGKPIEEGTVVLTKDS